MMVVLVALVLAVTGALLLTARVLEARAAARALHDAADDYSVNLGVWTSWQVRQWLHDRADRRRGGAR